MTLHGVQTNRKSVMLIDRWSNCLLTELDQWLTLTIVRLSVTYNRNLCSEKNFKDISDGVLICPGPMTSCTSFPVNIAHLPFVLLKSKPQVTVILHKVQYLTLFYIHNLLGGAGG
jgi:hypothetical protein